MTQLELQAILGKQIDQAVGVTGDEISAARSSLFDAYMGEPYGDEVKGRSSVVSTDVADTVEWIMPELMEIFTSGDEVVSFEPVGPDDEERAQQETDVVNHVFMSQNDGFLVLYSFLKDALIQRNGYVKRWWDCREDTTTEEYKGLTPDELMQLYAQWEQEQDEIEITGSDVDEDGIHVQVRLKRKAEGLKIAPVPPEEIVVAKRWNSVFLEDCPFWAHRKKETVSALIEMGYDRKQVEALPDANDAEFGEEKEERFDARNAQEDTPYEGADKSMREVLVHECYVKVDYDGDGIAETRRVMVAGSKNEVLRWGKQNYEGKTGFDNEEVENCPVSSWCPIITPHKHYGRSIAELVTDLQRIKTVMMRQMLDNIYLSNNPTWEIAEAGVGENTIEDMLVERPGRIVRTEMVGNLVPHQPPQFMGQLLPAIEYVDGVRESRTGVTRYNQGLDANSLNKTAEGVARIMNAAQKKIALIARIAAETGVKDLFRGIHGDLRRNATKALTVRLRGQWIDVDPRHWRNRSDVQANVALGTGDKLTKVSNLNMIASRQEQHLLAGSPLVTPQNLHHTMEAMTGAMGFKNPAAFWTDPSTVPPPEPKPDPEMIKVQGQLELQKQKNEGEAQLRMQDAHFDRQNKADEIILAREKMQAELQLAREKMVMEAQLERWKAQQELELKREQIAMGAVVTHQGNRMKTDASVQVAKAKPNGARK